MVAKIKQYWINLVTILENGVKRVVDFGGMVLTKIHNFFDVIITDIINVIHTIVNTFSHAVSAPGIAIMTVMGIIIVLDVVLSVKIGAVKYILETFQFVMGVITEHLWGTGVLAGSIGFLIICWTALKKIAK